MSPSRWILVIPDVCFASKVTRRMSAFGAKRTFGELPMSAMCQQRKWPPLVRVSEKFVSLHCKPGAAGLGNPNLPAAKRRIWRVDRTRTFPIGKPIEMSGEFSLLSPEFELGDFCSHELRIFNTHPSPKILWLVECSFSNSFSERKLDRVPGRPSDESWLIKP